MLILVRHGRTADNAAGLLLGRSDPPLDEVGIAQATAVARHIGPVASVVSSPMVRTRATAAQIRDDPGIDDRWVEMNYGDWEGRRVRDVPAPTWTRWMADPSFAPPGGESLEALGERVRAACDDLVEAATDGDVVVVSHVSPIKAAVAWVLGVPDEVTWHLFLAPGSITRIRLGGARRVLHSFNETGHLPHLDSA